MGPKRLQIHLILIFAGALTLLGCGHSAAGSGGGGGSSSSSAQASATTDAGNNGGGGSGGSGGGDSGQSSGGGGGAPIAIPNIIIHEGYDVYYLKGLIEQKAQQLCGGCVTVVVANTSATTCLSGYTASPPIAGNSDDPSAPYVVKRGTVITLMGGATCSTATTAPPTTAPPTTAPATIPPTAPPTSPAA